MVEHLQNLQLPVLVFLVLKDLLHGHHLQGSSVSGFVHHSKCATAHLILEDIPLCP